MNMDTLSEKLTRLYETHWDDFTAQLKAANLKERLQDPLLLSLALSGQQKSEREEDQEKAGYDTWYARKSTANHEDWYTKADVKIMFFGQETNGWARGCDVGELTAAYEDFLDDHYNADEGHFYTEGLQRGNRFMRWGINGIMSGVREMLEPYPGKRVAMIWNEISKLSARKGEGGTSVDAAAHEIERRYFHVIPKEVEILRPDILVFLTGPGENTYYNYIKENFTVGVPQQLASLPLHDVAKLPIEGVKLAYKTYHPGARGTTEEFHWQFYQAILDDIKANLDTLLQGK